MYSALWIALTLFPATTAAAKQLVASKGLYINNVPVQDPQQKLRPDDLLDGNIVVLRSGSQKQLVLMVAEPHQTHD